MAPRVTSVLISHPDIPHLGALPFAFARLGLRAPVFCTTPVRKMGQLFLQDLCRARATDESPAFGLDDVNAAFGLVQARAAAVASGSPQHLIPPLRSSPAPRRPL